jgi:hypothetical protein
VYGVTLIWLSALPEKLKKSFGGVLISLSVKLL